MESIIKADNEENKQMITKEKQLVIACTSGNLKQVKRLIESGAVVPMQQRNAILLMKNNFKPIVGLVFFTIAFITTVSVSLYRVGMCNGYENAKKLYETHPCKIIEEYRTDNSKYNSEYCVNYLKLEKMDTNKE
jgi:hypothetical protein